MSSNPKTLSRTEADALWDVLCSPAPLPSPKPMRSKASSRKAKKKAASDIFTELGRLTQSVVSSPWRAIELVLPVIRYTCSCGASFSSPSPKPLVRFIHKTNGSLTEKSNHPTRFNTSLPRTLRYTNISVEGCQHCFSSPSPSPQMDLFSSTEHAPYEHSLAVPVDASPSLIPHRYRMQEVYITRTVTETKPQPSHYLPLTVYKDRRTS